MLNAFKPLTITVPSNVLDRLKREALKRQTSVFGLLRDSFTFYTEATDVYSDAEIKAFLKKDTLPAKLKRDLDRLLA